MQPNSTGKLKLLDPDRRREPGSRAPDDPVRDGNGDIAAALRNLPSLKAPQGLWPRVREDFVESRRARSRRRWIASACAALVLVVAAGWAHYRSAAPSSAANREIRAAAETVVELEAASRHLEEVLSSSQLQAPVLTAAEAVAIVQLEDRLTLVDEAISNLNQTTGRSTDDAREAVFLWSHRVELLDALVEARGTPRSRGEIVYADSEWR